MATVNVSCVSLHRSVILFGIMQVSLLNESFLKAPEEQYFGSNKR